MDRSQGPVLKPSRIPPRPDRPQEEREQLAAEWLTRCHQGATPERIAELAPYTPEFPQGSIYARLADELVRSHVNPSNTQLKRLFRKNGRIYWKRAKRRQQRLAEAPIFESTEEQASVVAGWVHDFRERNGDGPTWSEVQAHFEWTRPNELRIGGPESETNGWTSAWNTVPFVPDDVFSKPTVNLKKNEQTT